MEGHVLRKFLYLDSKLLDDYLAGMQDVVVDEVVTETTQSSGGLEAGAGAAGVKAGGKKERSRATEVRREVKATDAMKFQRLYSTLEGQEGFTYWEAMSDDDWSRLSRNQLIEAEVELTQSTIGSIAGKLDGLMGLMQVIAPEEVDSDTAEAVAGLGLLGQLEASRGIPLKMELVASKKFKFIAHLNPDALRISRDELSGEATLFAKIRRKLAQSETMDLFDLLGGLDGLALNRDQKRALKKKAIPAELRNPVRAPAAIVVPIAIYL